MRYDAFLSYSHGADRFRAAAMQRLLQNLAKPFYRRKALNIFRDETALAANPKLWPTIERALSESRYFILLAGPESAASAWCGREVAWWLEHRSTETLLLVLTGGDLAYDQAQGDFDWRLTSALPEVLKSRFTAEPFYRDLRWATGNERVSVDEPRFRAEILPIAAALHGLEPEALDSEDLRQFRRARLFWRSASAGLAVLALTSVTMAWFAERKSNEAERERAIAVARQVAAQAETTRLARSADLPRSVLLAVEAARRLTAHNALSSEVDGTLRDGLALLPAKPAVLPHANVAALGVGADGKRLVSVSLDGWIGVWDLDRQTELARLDTGIKASRAVVSADLSTVAFAAEKEVFVVRVADGKTVAHVVHRSGVTALTFNRDGTLLAASSTDRSVSVTSVHDAREVARFVHVEPVETVAFSDDSHLIATGTGSLVARMQQRAPEDEAAHVWDIATGRRVARLPHPHMVQAVAFAPDSRKLVTGCLDGLARVWDIETQRELVRVAHPDAVAVLRLSPDGRHVASGSGPYLVGSKDQTVQVWALADGHEIRRVTHEDGIRSIAFSSNGQTIASASTDRTVRLSGADGREEARLALDDYASTLAFAPDGRRLIVGGRGLQIVRVERGFVPMRLGFDGHISKVAVSPVGRTVAVTDGNAVAVWEFGKSAPLFQVNHDGFILDVAFSADGRWLATASADKSAAIWNAATGTRHANVLHDAQVVAVAFNPDGRTLATASSDTTARVWDVETGKEMRRLAHASPVIVMHYDRDGRRLVTGTKAGEVRVWDVASGNSLMGADVDGDLYLLALSPDGRRLAWARSNAFARLWDVDSGNELPKLQHGDSLADVAWSPDGRLVTRTWNGNIRVWSADGKGGDAVIRHEGGSAMTFSDDGRYLATGSSDRTARVWRFPELVEVIRLRHPIAIRNVIFSADDRFLIAWSGDILSPGQAIRLWPLSLDTLVAEACARLPRNLTLDEWRQHLPAEPYRRTCPNLPSHVSVLVPLLDRAKSAAAAGHEREARRRYDALAREADNTDDPAVANEICWTGALDGAARQVLPSCERAVTVGGNDANLRDSRGIARALVGDSTGAIEDFKAFIGWAKKTAPQSALISKRADWVAALERGRNPFDANTLAALRKGE